MSVEEALAKWDRLRREHEALKAELEDLRKAYKALSDHHILVEREVLTLRGK